SGGSTINVSGGSIGNFLWASNSSTLNVYGHNLVLRNPIPMANGVRYTLRGFLTDGTDVTGRYVYILDQAKTNLPRPPTLLTLANLSKNVYTGVSGYAEYSSIGTNSDIISDQASYTGFKAVVYSIRGGKQIVIAFRGTDLEDSTLIA